MTIPFFSYIYCEYLKRTAVKRFSCAVFDDKYNYSFALEISDSFHAKGMLWISGTQWKFSVSVVGQNEIQVKIKFLCLLILIIQRS